MTIDEETRMTAALRDMQRTLRGAPIFAFYVVATLVVATIVGLITVNVIDLGMTHFGQASHRIHDVTYGALFTTLVVGVIVQLRRPARNIGGMVMALIPAGALLLAGVLAGDLDRVFQFNPLRYAAAVAVVTALVHPSGRDVLRSFRPTRISWPMMALVGVAAVPLLAFASSSIELQRSVTDSHASMGHYGFMAALGYTVIAAGVIASLRPIGWRLTAWMTGLLAGQLGATSLLDPDSASSLDTAWALAALAWGVIFVATAARTTDADTPITPDTTESEVAPEGIRSPNA